MGELWAARAAVGVAIGSWRASRGLEEPEFAERLNDTALVMMEHMLTTGWDRTAALLGAATAARPGSVRVRCRPAGTPSSARRWSR